jgi:MoaA/NifB/PqqE/SkfB family radical SAM enzyme
MRFDESPLLVSWETTQACDLACVHCRSSAAPQRHSSELSTEEAYRLLEAIREFGNPLMAFAGGDPLKRPDILPLLRRSVDLGLRMNISPSATPLLTRDKIWEFRKCGVARMAISLDGPDAETHDGLGGVPGTFHRAVEALEDARRIGLETQIRTTVTRRNMHRLDRIASLAATLRTRQIFEKLYHTPRLATFDVKINEAKTNEAMHFRRYMASRVHQPAELVSHTGEIYPYRFRRGTCDSIRWRTSIEIRRSSWSCSMGGSMRRAMRMRARASAPCASATNRAAAPAREPMPVSAINWLITQDAPISHVQRPPARVRRINYAKSTSRFRDYSMCSEAASFLAP